MATSPARIEAMRVLAEFLHGSRAEIEDGTRLAGLPNGWQPEDEDHHAQIIWSEIATRCDCGGWRKSSEIGCDLCMKSYGNVIHIFPDMDVD